MHFHIINIQLQNCKYMYVYLVTLYLCLNQLIQFHDGLNLFIIVYVTLCSRGSSSLRELPMEMNYLHMNKNYQTEYCSVYEYYTPARHLILKIL